jgi:ankyrin repeat protein
LNVTTTSETEKKNNRFVMAAARGDWREFNKCIEAGQELSVMHSQLGYTALHAACEFGAKDMVAALFKLGVAVNIKDYRHGQTPLHYAALGGKVHIARMLLEHGADRSIANNRGYLAYEIAEEEGHLECSEVLKHTPPEVVHFVVCTDTQLVFSRLP